MEQAPSPGTALAGRLTFGRPFSWLKSRRLVPRLYFSAARCNHDRHRASQWRPQRRGNTGFERTGSLGTRIVTTKILLKLRVGLFFVAMSLWKSSRCSKLETLNRRALYFI